MPFECPLSTLRVSKCPSSAIQVKKKVCNKYYRKWTPLLFYRVFKKMFQNIYFANIVYCFLRNKSVNSIMFYKPDIIIKRGFKYFLKIFCRKSNMIDFRALFLVKLWCCSRSVQFDYCSCRITEFTWKNYF